MTKLRVINFAVSLDGYVAGVDQTLDDPLGTDGERLHEWAVQTKWFGGPGEAGTASTTASSTPASRTSGPRSWAATCSARCAATWGDEHVDRLVGRTRRTTTRCSCSPTTPATPIEMEGGTTFHFVTDGIESAFEQATAAAGGAGHPPRGWRVDHPAVPARRARRRACTSQSCRSCSAPGERLLDRTDRLDGFGPPEIVASTTVTHLTWRKA